MLGRLLRSLSEADSGKDASCNDNTRIGSNSRPVMRRDIAQTYFSPSFFTPKAAGSEDESSPEKIIIRRDFKELAVSNLKSKNISDLGTCTDEEHAVGSCALSDLFGSPPSNLDADILSFQEGKPPLVTPRRTPSQVARPRECIDRSKATLGDVRNALLFDRSSVRLSPTSSAKQTSANTELFHMESREKEHAGMFAETASTDKLSTPSEECSECNRWKSLLKKTMTELDAHKAELNQREPGCNHTKEIESLKEMLSQYKGKSKVMQEEYDLLKACFEKNEDRLKFFEAKIKNEVKSEMEDGWSKARALETQLKILREELSDLRGAVIAARNREQDLHKLLGEAHESVDRQHKCASTKLNEFECEVADLENKLNTTKMENSKYQIKIAELTCLRHKLEDENNAYSSRLLLSETTHSSLKQEKDFEIARLTAIINNNESFQAVEHNFSNSTGDDAEHTTDYAFAERGLVFKSAESHPKKGSEEFAAEVAVK